MNKLREFLEKMVAACSGEHFTDQGAMVAKEALVLLKAERKGHALVSLEQLEEIEYSDYSSDDPDDDDPKCPVCGVWRSVTRHGDDCWLDAKIKEAEGE